MKVGVPKSYSSFILALNTTGTISVGIGWGTIIYIEDNIFANIELDILVPLDQIQNIPLNIRLAPQVGLNLFGPVFSAVAGPVISLEHASYDIDRLARIPIYRLGEYDKLLFGFQAGIRVKFW
jgi:hypothetical protein